MVEKEDKEPEKAEFTPCHHAFMQWRDAVENQNVPATYRSAFIAGWAAGTTYLERKEEEKDSKQNSTLERQFQPGDVVQLRSGGVEMVIDSVDYKSLDGKPISPQCYCVWLSHDGNIINYNWFPAHVLKFAD